MADAVFEKVGQCPVGVLQDSNLMGICSSCQCELNQDDPGGDFSVETKFNTFARQHQFSGEKIPIPTDELLGRITSLEGTAGFLAQHVPGVASRTEAADRLRWLAGLGSSDQRQDAQDWFDMYLNVAGIFSGRGVTASPPHCWLFRGDEHHSPRELLESPTRDDLPCRLGLPSFISDRPHVPSSWYLGFTMLAERARNPKRPSVFDGDYLAVREVWVPTGLTQPLPWAGPDCIRQTGLPEVLAEGVTYDEIDPSIFVFKSKAHP